MRRRPFIVAGLLAASLLCCGFNFTSFRNAGGGATGKVRLEPSPLVVGEPFAFIVEIEAPSGSGAEGLQIVGLPDPGAAPVEYGEAENLPDGAAAKGKVLKRIRLPGRFMAPFTNACRPVAQGQLVVRKTGAGFSSTSMNSFSAPLGTVSVEVRPLPEAGRPVDFSGAVGRSFRMTQKAEPDHVRPGDLVTASYVLEFDGYCPSNAVPRIEHLGRWIKAYVPKEEERKAHRVVWTQVLVPRTTAATNTALVSMNYYNVETRRYEVARAAPRPLVFVSAQAAPTAASRVAVDEPAAVMGPRPDEPMVLRFGPSDRSPVVVTLPAEMPRRETAREGAWRRLESSRGSGWTKNLSESGNKTPLQALKMIK